MNRHQHYRAVRVRQAARARQRKRSQQSVGGSSPTSQGRANHRKPLVPDGAQGDNFRDDTENKTAIPTHEDPISAKLKERLDAVCEDAEAALGMGDSESAAHIFKQRIQPELSAFYHGSFESQYCLMIAAYKIGRGLKHKRGRGLGGPMLRAILGPGSSGGKEKIYLRVLQRSIQVPKTGRERKLVQSNLSAYNRALEQADYEGLDDDQLLYRLSKSGGINRLLRKSRQRTAKEKEGSRVKKQTIADAIPAGASNTAPSQDDLFHSKAAGPTTNYRRSQERTGRYARPEPGSVRRFAPLNASLEVEDEAYLTIARGSGLQIAIIDVAQTRPVHVTINLAHDLRDYNLDDVKVALDRLVERLSSPKTKE